jgi:ABC-type transporter Mla subunit MlaD
VTRFVCVAAASAALSFVAAGCGGGASSEEKWADSVCTDVATWQTQVKQSASDVKAKLQSPQSGMLAAVRTDIQQAVDATKQMASDLKALDPPGGDAGANAQQKLESYATQVQSTVTQAKQTVASVPSGATTSETVQALRPLAPALQSLRVETSTLFQSLKATSEKIKQGFDDADSCSQFS